jgi:hypothetical protein
MEWDTNRAFWFQNMVSNFVYYRWSDDYPILKEKLGQVQHDFEHRIEKLQREVQELVLAFNAALLW